VTSHATKTKIKLWHARLGGVSFERLKELGKLYPKLVKIPLMATFDGVCQCCQRSCMRKCNAAGEITRLPQPLEEIHFDVFDYDSTYTFFLIDRGSRACWAYQLQHKSDVPAPYNNSSSIARPTSSLSGIFASLPSAPGTRGSMHAQSTRIWNIMDSTSA
jgi:hypothetical protein